MRKARWIVVAGVLALAGCGGGSDSTGSTPVTPGVYRGNMLFSVSAAGANRAANAPIIVRVSPEQTVTIGTAPGAAPIRRSSFSLPVNAAALNGPGLTCTQGVIVFDGTFRGTGVDGTLSSDGVRCNGLPVTLAGTYGATLQAQVRRDGAAAPDVLDALREAIRAGR